MTKNEKIAVAGGGVVIVIILVWLFGQRNTAATSGQAAAAPYPLSSGDWPPNFYNLSFQAPPGSVTPGPGYVPLFGFLGYGREWM